MKAKIVRDWIDESVRWRTRVSPTSDVRHWMDRVVVLGNEVQRLGRLRKRKLAKPNR